MLKRIAIAVVMIVAFAVAARAQFGVPRGLPLTMTMTLEKPAPEQTFGGRRLIELGVGSQSYRFVLRDFFVDDPAGKFFSDDIWRQVEQHRPNLMVRGWDENAVKNIKPGETVTLQGIYAPITRTFEVALVKPGPGFAAPPKSY